MGAGKRRREQVRVIDEDEAGGGSDHPGQHRGPDFALAEDKETQQDDGRPGRCPQVRQDQKVLIEEVKIPDDDGHGGDGSPENAGRERRLPSQETNAKRLRDEPGGVHVQIIRPDLTQDDEGEKWHRDRGRRVLGDHRQDARIARQLGVDGRQEQAEQSQQQHRQRDADDRPPGDRPHGATGG